MLAYLQSCLKYIGKIPQLNWPFKKTLQNVYRANDESSLKSGGELLSKLNNGRTVEKELGIIIILHVHG